MWKGYRGIYNRFVKRLFDIICSLLAIVLFGWLYILLAVLVRIKLGKPVIFTQDRPGKIDPKTGEEKVFKLYKFRSMTNEKDENGRLLPDVKRLTKFGRTLRSTSLDELPEAFNILKGDMSVIGPRPLVKEYIPYYTKEERRRHLVRPGLSGNAQVHGRNALSWEKRFEMDVDYVDNVSLRFDLELIFETVLKVIKRSDIGQGEELPISFSEFRRKQLEGANKG